jgi:hypothetical protein
MMGILENIGSTILIESAKRIFKAVPKGIENRKFRKFFGPAAYDGENIYAVVDPFSHPSPPHSTRYIKHFLGRKPDLPIIGVNDVLGICVVRIVAYCASAFSEHRKEGRSITIVKDSDAISSWDGTYLAFGSSDSNIRTFEIETLKEQTFYKFDFGPHGYRRITVGNHYFDSGPRQDFGIILKMLNPYSSGHLLFICAGLGEWGTSGAAHFLLGRWPDLYKRHKTSEFAVCKANIAPP